MDFKEPKRENAPLLIGLAGGTGSGKTYSALRLARGLANGQPFAVIDTENGRALHYADFFPEMRHGRLDAPFSPAAYSAAVADADAQGFPVIVVDSASHIWEGEGGVLDMQLAEVQRLGSGDNVKMLTWVKPKTAHKAFVRQLLRTKAHVILAMRAEDKIEIVNDPEKPGKKKVIPKQTLKGAGLDGWIPICEKRLPFEMTLSFLLTSEHPGIPKPIKLQEQHKPFFPLDQQVGEETGKRLAEWAAGTSSLAEVKEAVGSADGNAADPDASAENLASEILARVAADKYADVERAILANRDKHADFPARHIAWLESQLEKFAEGGMTDVRIVPVATSDQDYDECLALFANRNEVAEDYARLLSRSGPKWDGFAPINKAIVRRWSMAGLKYIKERAWKIATQNL